MVWDRDLHMHCSDILLLLDCGWYRSWYSSFVWITIGKLIRVDRSNSTLVSFRVTRWMICSHPTSVWWFKQCIVNQPLYLLRLLLLDNNLCLLWLTSIFCFRSPMSYYSCCASSIDVRFLSLLFFLFVSLSFNSLIITYIHSHALSTFSLMTILFCWTFLAINRAKINASLFSLRRQLSWTNINRTERSTWGWSFASQSFARSVEVIFRRHSMGWHRNETSSAARAPHDRSYGVEERACDEFLNSFSCHFRKALIVFSYLCNYCWDTTNTASH